LGAVVFCNIRHISTWYENV